MDILSKIVSTKQKRLKNRQQELPLAELQRMAKLIKTDGVKRFEDAVRRTDSRMRIIAELKKASPSAGLIRKNFEVLKLAQDYKEGGADALSVLTEEDYFLGNLEFIRQIRQQYPELPILRKDFIFDEYQL
ncbi:MAG: indole-3-glycerol-phosphate synthase TrpC, partial [Candidatus Sumerlaeia bacterium]|nr:indole-3-glycerol-phosphate synthase TrpC [Candidatus Sumerlaeia bacterium]